MRDRHRDDPPLYKKTPWHMGMVTSVASFSPSFLHKQVVAVWMRLITDEDRRREFTVWDIKPLQFVLLMTH